jgi:hypothetical protein
MKDRLTSMLHTVRRTTDQLILTGRTHDLKERLLTARTTTHPLILTGRTHVLCAIKAIFMSVLFIFTFSLGYPALWCGLIIFRTQGVGKQIKIIVLKKIDTMI